MVRLRRFRLLSVLLCTARPLAAAPTPSVEPSAEVVTEPDAGAPAPTDAVQASARNSIGSVEFEWMAPAECPSQAEVIADARSLISHEPPGDRARMRARAVAAHESDGRWRLDMNVAGSSRTVEGASCEELARAAALFLALLVDPIQHESAVAPARIEPRPRKLAVLSDHTEGPAVRPRSTVWETGAGVTGDVGTLPRPTALGTISVGAWFDRARLAVAAGAGLGQDVVAAGSTVAHLTPSLLAASGCYVWRTQAWDWGPYVSTELGLMRSQTIGLSSGGAGAWIWWGGGGGLLFALRPTRALRVEASIGGLFPIVRPAFQVAGIGVVYEQRAAARGALAAAMVF